MNTNRTHARLGHYGLIALVGFVVVVVVMLSTGRRTGDSETRTSAKSSLREYVPVGDRDPSTLRLRESVSRICLADEASLDEKVEILRGLAADLSRDEIDAILELVESASAGTESSARFGYLINEALNALHRQPEHSPRMAEVVVGLAEGPARDELVRDYALQHLRVVWGRAHHNPGARRQIERSLWRAVESRHRSRAATALVSLHNLGSQGGRVSEDPAGVRRAIGTPELRDAALGVLQRPNESPASRMAALRILNERGIQQGVDQVRLIAARENEIYAVRLAAIAGLGHLGSPEDRVMLERLRLQPRWQTAAEHALTVLQPDSF